MWRGESPSAHRGAGRRPPGESRRGGEGPAMCSLWCAPADGPFSAAVVGQVQAGWSVAAGTPGGGDCAHVRGPRLAAATLGTSRRHPATVVSESPLLTAAVGAATATRTAVWWWTHGRLRPRRTQARSRGGSGRDPPSLHPSSGCGNGESRRGAAHIGCELPFRSPPSPRYRGSHRQFISLASEIGLAERVHRHFGAQSASPVPRGAVLYSEGPRRAL